MSYEDLTINNTDTKSKKSSRKKFFLRLGLGLFALVVVMVFSSIAYYLYQISSPVSRGGEQQIVDIKDGSSSEQIATQLQSAGLIRDKNVFLLYVKIGPAKGLLKPGPYALKPTMNTVQIVNYLHAGKIAIKKITFPEGLTIAQMAARYEKIGFGTKDEFTQAAKQPYKYGFLEKLPAGASLEGYLYPDTYTLKINSTANELIDKMLATFEQKAWPALTSRQVEGMSPHQLLILSSIVEHEGLTDQDRGMIAGVFYNRLARGMKLESDVTISYETGRKQVSAADLKIKSPYNSYLNAGLPPGPICSPSLNAITATVSPTKSENLYFLADINNKVYYAPTYSEHQENIAKYLQ